MPAPQVNNAFATPPGLGEGQFRSKFYDQSTDMWDVVHGVGLRGHYLCSCHAARLMVPRRRGLLVQVSSFGGASYTFNVAYGVAKCALDRLTADMARELAGDGVDAVTIYPGVVRTEGNLELQRQGRWEQESGGLDLDQGESPRFSGRAVVALAAMEAQARAARSGAVVVVAELARELGFTDIDGKQPPSIRSMQFLVPNFVLPSMRAQGLNVPAWVERLVPDILVPWETFRQGPPPEA